MVWASHVDDSLVYLASQDEGSFQAVVTDPPFGPTEYEPDELESLRAGTGGVWREPPKGRRPLPRFTELKPKDIQTMREFFSELAFQLHRVLVPGAHVIIAANPLLSQYVWMPFLEMGFEKRGEIVRLVQTLRGGDRPKNAEEDFPDVTVMPRSAWEPWGIFRKPCEGRVQDNLRKYGTGGLRRESVSRPFTDVIKSGLPTDAERAISDHPSLKPQNFMRRVVRAALPFGTGVLLDPFMGSGSTIAAAQRWGYQALGLERDRVFYEKAVVAVPKLAALEDNLDERNLFDQVMNLPDD